MKTCIIIILWVLPPYICNVQNTNTLPLPTGKLPDQPVSIIDFEKEIKPIFIKNCSPCHFPGGKMYGRLPFDKDTTIINHSASILKRIKNADENALLKEFVSQNKSGPSEDKPH